MAGTGKHKSAPLACKLCFGPAASSGGDCSGPGPGEPFPERLLSPAAPAGLALRPLPQVSANNEICEEVKKAGGVALALRILSEGAPGRGWAGRRGAGMVNRGAEGAAAAAMALQRVPALGRRPVPTRPPPFSHLQSCPSRRWHAPPARCCASWPAATGSRGRWWRPGGWRWWPSCWRPTPATTACSSRWVGARRGTLNRLGGVAGAVLLCGGQELPLFPGPWLLGPALAGAGMGLWHPNLCVGQSDLRSMRALLIWAMCLAIAIEARTGDFPPFSSLLGGGHGAPCGTYPVELT